MAGDAIRDIEELQELLATIDSWLSGPEETSAVSDSLAAESSTPADTLLAALTDTLAIDTVDQSLFFTMLGDSLSTPTDTPLALLDSLAVAPEDTLVSAEPDTVVIPDEARAMFRAGEIYLFKMENAEEAVGYYEMVVEYFGETPIGPKAALAAAWARSEMLGEPMRSAEAYRLILEMYPGTDFAREAERALGLEPVEPEPVEQVPMEPPAGESAGGEEEP